MRRFHFHILHRASLIAYGEGPAFCGEAAALDAAAMAAREPLPSVGDGGVGRLAPVIGVIDPEGKLLKTDDFPHVIQIDAV